MSFGFVRSAALAAGCLSLVPAVLAESRYTPQPIHLSELRTLRVTTTGKVLIDEVQKFDGVDQPEVYGPGCQQTSSHTDASFTGGQYTVQAGFAEQEIAAASYTLPASAFPLRVDLVEAIFATAGTSVQTTTHWSLLVWQGTPNNGNLVAEFSSDGLILPHIVLPPGAPAAVNVSVAVDPNDPEQIIITNDGSNTFSIGYRIDKHHAQTGDGCTQAPPTSLNAFPTTDTSGLLRPSNNWLRGVNCGLLGCPPNGGWSTFGNLNIFCRPSGDWVMRATWTPLNCTPGSGACCLTTGACDIRLASDCAALGGLYQGDGTTCTGVSCPQPTGACCFPSTGGCLNLQMNDCTAAGGIYGGNGTACATFVCFPEGACCLPNGTCTGPVTPAQCQDQGGVFQGNATSCGSVTCPQPTGACCFPSTGGCLNLTETNCVVAGGAWKGAGTNCSQAGVCAASTCGDCADTNCDGTISVSDIGPFVAAVTGGEAGWAATFDGDPPCDYLCANDMNNDNAVSVGDIGAFVSRIANGTPCD
jgi:hypothetical protein